MDLRRGDRPSGRHSFLSPARLRRFRRVPQGKCRPVAEITPDRKSCASAKLVRGDSPGFTQPGLLQARDIYIYHACDFLSGALIFAAVVFCPWAFGTTQSWSIWTMNVGGYALGLLLAAKLWLRRFKGYSPPRWAHRNQALDTDQPRQGATTTLLAVTAVFLLYILTSALNAASTYHPAELSFSYHRHLNWLPHSLDASRTWRCFWNYLALACSFWALRDWLLGKGQADIRSERSTGGAGPDPGSIFPTRLNVLLWLLAINGALLAIEGLAQRFEGSGRLLFLVRPRVNPGAETQFGPWAYRANAAAWFNLLWPVCLGFWWTLHCYGTRRSRSHHWLLVSTLVMAVCPIVSTSRGGALVTFGLLTASVLFLLVSALFLRSRRVGWRGWTAGSLVLLFSLGTLGLGMQLGWKALAPRMAQIGSNAELREQMYDNARPMARDYPFYGTGAGTFETVFQLYRASTATYWPAQLHNDWLETRITFGGFGSLLIAIAFGSVMVRWFEPRGIHGGRRFVGLVWLAMTGCFVHARFDFPFQIYSILFLFLMLCAILSVLTRRPTGE